MKDQNIKKILSMKRVEDTIYLYRSLSKFLAVCLAVFNIFKFIQRADMLIIS